jgi:hypothetical protein
MNTMELNANVLVDTVFRLGKKNITKPRNVKVTFVTLEARNLVYTSRIILREKKVNIFINEDLPHDIPNKRKLLRDEFKKAKQMGKNATLKGDILTINNANYEIDFNNRLVEKVEEMVTSA